MISVESEGYEKNLNIDSYYYNKLDIEGFSLMMKDPTCCYKFYWLEAIVQLICEDKIEASYDEIINEMIANAWYSVLQFHIHLSSVNGNGEVNDTLEKAVLKLKDVSNLLLDSSKVEIKNEIKKFDYELKKEKKTLTQYVPYRALSGFANKKGEEIKLDSKVSRIIAYYNKLNENDILLPYTFGEEKGLKRIIKFNQDWIQMIRDNAVNILGWIQYEKVKWLQRNNPEVPGLIYKLKPLDNKTRKLEQVKKLWNGILDIRPISNVFDDTLIKKEKYDIDHFIPWSFVMNDELWNLMPMDSKQNSVKSDKLPNWDKFFKRFAKNQYILYEMIHKQEKIANLYHKCYQNNLHSIWAMQELYQKGNTSEKFYTILEKNMRPIYDSAKRQGYEIWKTK